MTKMKTKPAAPVLNIEEALGTLMKTMTNMNGRLLAMEEKASSMSYKPSAPAKPLPKAEHKAEHKPQSTGGTVQIIFDVPINSITTSKNGEWLNLPYEMEGRTVGLKGRKVYYKFGKGLMCRKDQSKEYNAAERRPVDEDVFG
jgi:hypothetical protein